MQILQHARKLFDYGIARAFAGTMAVSTAAKVAQFLMAVLLARKLEPEGYGLFTFALGFGLVAGRLGALGWPMLMLRFIPRYCHEEDWPALKGLLYAATWVVLGASLTLTLLVLSGALWFGPNHKLYEGLILGGLMLPIMALRSIMRNKLAGHKAPAKGVLIDEFLPAALVCMVILLPVINTASAAVAVYWASSFCAILVGTKLLIDHRPNVLRNTEADFRLRSWMAIAVPALVGMSAKLLMNKTDVIMIAPLADLEQVGLYGVALRVTYLQTFPIVVLSTVLAPRISEAIAAGNYSAARRLFFGGLTFAFLVAGVISLFLIFGRHQIISSLFGNSYAQATPILVILAISQIAASLGIPATSYLLVSGREKVFGLLTTTALAINVALNFYLVPTYGAYGAAIATLLATTLLVSTQITLCFRSSTFRSKGD